MCVRALLPDNGIFLFFLSLSAGKLSGSSAFARAACAGHLLYVSSVCAPFLVLGIVQTHFLTMSIGLCYQRLPRQTTGQQTVRPRNNIPSCSSLLSQLFQQSGAALQHILPCGFKIPGVPRVCHIAGAKGIQQRPFTLYHFLSNSNALSIGTQSAYRSGQRNSL